MSSDNIIEITGLSKCYQIYDSPKDRLMQMFFRSRKQLYREFWALKNVSFSLKKGETVGIIGRNGSGKSTLLQMICGTLTPTDGTVKVNGRIAALLELGAGFNPEFTGHENIFMAASLYGLTNEQIRQRYDKILAFADIGDYIDQPVKTYSSGMYVRLAFAVIAHVDADILVVDEALAVGDAVFTQKCMRFIRKFKENGTLLFVSHDTQSVINLCDKAIWLHKGEMISSGKAKAITEKYLQYTLQEVYGDETKLDDIKNNKQDDVSTDQSQLAIAENTTANDTFDYNSQYGIDNNLSDANGWKTGAGEIIDVSFSDVATGNTHHLYKGGEKVKLRITASINEPFDSPILGFLVKDRLGQVLFGENTLPFTNKNAFSVGAGETMTAEYVFTLPMLPNGEYSMMVSLANGDINTHVQHHWLHDALIINVSSSDVRWGLVGIKFDDVKLEKE
ncbi:ABC transporter ATP-binding protein [Klebsiella quasipneumoniae subsp. quasipneumoniae]|uniref:ABC transporter ATP-binding protein n=1 Tax=Klebsiella pneumoniae complex TaxID=3390273 RepID=UPI0009B99954|nr:MULTISPECIES: ABC transporter ATP-binding protein [Klebsiella]EKW4788827.1 ABC transporter ATP-binding protein [Klebsiella variicola]UDC72541.1 ABC transporter ATP-binding protein [Klebsiella quasipneumoniae subsp. quasipneumoniae]WPI72100.1 ABC transporter ATP-binding protein [Klebsiella pneumoniae]SLP32340.1 O-antigen export-NBD component [Klebsiella variicola]VGP66370.1 Teichoic acids export ATP-binding protein TagH [Klebsiella quasipneumoniae subsp. quasipneumoniae]